MGHKIKSLNFLLYIKYDFFHSKQNKTKSRYKQVLNFILISQKAVAYDEKLLKTKQKTEKLSEMVNSVRDNFL